MHIDVCDAMGIIGARVYVWRLMIFLVITTMCQCQGGNLCTSITPHFPPLSFILSLSFFSSPSLAGWTLRSLKRPCNSCTSARDFTCVKSDYNQACASAQPSYKTRKDLKPTSKPFFSCTCKSPCLHRRTTIRLPCFCKAFIFAIFCFSASSLSSWTFLLSSSAVMPVRAIDDPAPPPSIPFIISAIFPPPLRASSSVPKEIAGLCIGNREFMLEPSFTPAAVRKSRIASHILFSSVYSSKSQNPPSQAGSTRWTSRQNSLSGTWTLTVFPLASLNSTRTRPGFAQSRG